MYGYIRQGQRTVLTREVIGGVPFWVLTAGRGWQRLRVRSLLRRLARHGVRTAVFEGDTWQTAAARYGIHPVPVGALRLAKLEELLDCLCPALSGKTVRLCVGKDGGTARQAANARRAVFGELSSAICAIHIFFPFCSSLILSSCPAVKAARQRQKHQW